MDCHFSGLNLPEVWYCTSIDEIQYMFGFLPSAPYSFYITDMRHLWSDIPSVEEVHQLAQNQGILDFGEEKTAYLVKQLSESFSSYPNAAFSFSRHGDALIKAEIRLSANLTWPLKAQLNDPSHFGHFFNELSCRNFANHNFLLYKIARLESMIRARDKYLLYLEENYKTVNGTELMDKYRRQHPDAKPMLQKFSRQQFDSDTNKHYIFSVSKRGDVGRINQLWAFIASAIHDYSTWRSSALLSLKRKSREESDQEDDESLNHSKQTLIDVKDQAVKLEDNHTDSTESSSILQKDMSTSPSKRRRIGVIGRLRK